MIGPNLCSRGWHSVSSPSVLNISQTLETQEPAFPIMQPDKRTRQSCLFIGPSLPNKSPQTYLFIYIFIVLFWKRHLNVNLTQTHACSLLKKHLLMIFILYNMLVRVQSTMSSAWQHVHVKPTQVTVRSQWHTVSVSCLSPHERYWPFHRNSHLHWAVHWTNIHIFIGTLHLQKVKRWSGLVVW